MTEPSATVATTPGRRTTHWQNLALAGAGPALTVCGMILVWIIWHGGWPEALAKARIDYLGIALWIVLGLLGFVIVASTAGLVKGLDVSLGALKANVDMSGGADTTAGTGQQG